MKSRRVYDGRFKAKVIVEHLRDHESIAELAGRYEIHPNQIKNWRSVLFRHAEEIFDDKRRKRRAEKKAHDRNL